MGRSWENDEHIVSALHSGGALRSRNIKTLNSTITFEEVISISCIIHEPYTAWTQEKEGQLLKEDQKIEEDNTTGVKTYEKEIEYLKSSKVKTLVN